MNDGTNRSAGALFLATENLRGIMLMVVARLVFAGSDTFTKLASEGLPASEVVVLRNAISLPIVFFMAWRLGGLRHPGAFCDRLLPSRSVLQGPRTLAFVAARPYV